MNFADLLLHDAKQRGLDHFFGIPGSGFPMDAMESGKKLGVDFIHVAHESTAAIAAGFYGEQKNTAGLALAVKGVGAANLVGGATNVFFERKPLLCVCEAGPEKQLIDLVQVIDHFKLFGSICSYQTNIRSKTAREQLKTAVTSATSERPGVSLINIPSDYEDEDCGLLPEYKKVETKINVNNSKLKEISTRISKSKFPLFIVGTDVQRDNASDELIYFVEKIGGAVLVNMDSRGVFPENHKRWAGVFTGNYEPETIEGEIESEADLIILIGTDSMMTHIPWAFNSATIEIASHSEHNSTSNSPEFRINGNLKSLLNNFSNITPHSKGFSLQIVLTILIIKGNFLI